MKYAKVERERRYLLSELPDLSDARILRVVDRYLSGTRLRLRTVLEPGRPTVYKLGQKIRLDAVSTNAHTTIYLSAVEHAGLAQLPGHDLVKTRYLKDGWAFDEHESGLLVAETDHDLAPLFGYLREVTDEVEFTGARLAGALLHP